MKLSKRSAVLIATGITGAMALTACGGGSDGGGGGDSGGSGRVVYGEATDWPENLMPLISAGNATSTANIEAQLLPGVPASSRDFSLKYDDQLLTEEPTSRSTATPRSSRTRSTRRRSGATASRSRPTTSSLTWNTQKSSDPRPGRLRRAAEHHRLRPDRAVDGLRRGQDRHGQVRACFPDWQAYSRAAVRFSKHVYRPGHAGRATARTSPTAGRSPTACPRTSPTARGCWRSEHQRTVDQIVALTQNPKYWGDTPKLASWSTRTSAPTRTPNVKGLQNQEVNMIYPQPQLDLVASLTSLSRTSRARSTSVCRSSTSTSTPRTRAGATRRSARRSRWRSTGRRSSTRPSASSRDSARSWTTASA